jgi:hypothetical protein
MKSLASVRFASAITSAMLKLNNSEGIRTPAGRAQWISSPSPKPLGHAVLGLYSQAVNDRKGTMYKNGYEIRCLMPTHDLGQFTYTCSRHADELWVADLITHDKRTLIVLMSSPGVEPGSSRPQRDVPTTRR